MNITTKATQLPPKSPDVLSTVLYQLQRDTTILMERQISVLLNPKPRWLPSFVWRRLVRMMLTVVEER